MAYIGPNLRTERLRKSKIDTEVAHVARDSDTSFKVKGQLVADVLNNQHAGIGATWQINTKILSTCRGRRHIVAADRLQLVFAACFRHIWQKIAAYAGFMASVTCGRTAENRAHLQNIGPTLVSTMGPLPYYAPPLGIKL